MLLHLWPPFLEQTAVQGIGSDEEMTRVVLESVLVGLIALGLLVYLVYVLLRPERF